MSRPSKYTKEQINKAKQLRKQGYQMRAIAKYLGFARVETLYYHISPNCKKQHYIAVANYYKKNRPKILKKMTEYAQKHKPWRK